MSRISTFQDFLNSVDDDTELLEEKNTITCKYCGSVYTIRSLHDARQLKCDSCGASLSPIIDQTF